MSLTGMYLVSQILSSYLDSGMGTVRAGCEGVRSRSLTEQRLGQWVVQGVWSEVGAKVVRG